MFSASCVKGFAPSLVFANSKTLPFWRQVAKKPRAAPTKKPVVAKRPAASSEAEAAPTKRVAAAKAAPSAPAAAATVAVQRPHSRPVSNVARDVDALNLLDVMGLPL